MYLSLEPAEKDEEVPDTGAEGKVSRKHLTKRTNRRREEQSEFWNEFHRYLMSGENQ